MKSLDGSLNQSMAITLLLRAPLGSQPNLCAFPSDLVSTLGQTFLCRSFLCRSFLLVTNPSLSLSIYEAKSSSVCLTMAGWKIQKCQFEMTHVMKSLQNCLSFIAVTKSWGGGRERRIKNNNCLLFLFSQWGFCDLFIRHNMCQLFNS